MEDDSKKWLGEVSERSLRQVGIKKGDIVLDFGCGSGNYTIPAARIVGEEGRVYAIDKDGRDLGKLMRKANSEGLKNIEKMETSGKLKIDLEDESVDVVLLYDILHYYYFPKASDRRRLLPEVYRILKPGALLSVYPTHLQSNMHPKLEDVKREINDAKFHLERECSVMLIHKETPEKSQVLNFRKARKTKKGSGNQRLLVKQYARRNLKGDSKTKDEAERGRMLAEKVTYARPRCR
jgi:SAM-dependent methyltransferase